MFTRLFKRSGNERFVGTGVAEGPNVLQSLQGRYFLGRSGLLPVPSGQEALVLLRNQINSSRRTFVVAVTLTSDHGRRAFVQFGPETSVALQTSKKVASAHRGLPDEPVSMIQMGVAPRVPLAAGTDVFERLLRGGDTLELAQEGRVILEPGRSIGVWFEAIQVPDQIDIAFGWWEEPLS